MKNGSAKFSAVSSKANCQKTSRPRSLRLLLVRCSVGCLKSGIGLSESKLSLFCEFCEGGGLKTVSSVAYSVKRMVPLRMKIWPTLSKMRMTVLHDLYNLVLMMS
jgi:hypothetical protein